MFLYLYFAVQWYFSTVFIHDLWILDIINDIFMLKTGKKSFFRLKRGLRKKGPFIHNVIGSDTTSLHMVVFFFIYVFICSFAFGMMLLLMRGAML